MQQREKKASYEDLVYRAKQTGYDSHLITIEVRRIMRGPTHGRLLQTKARTRTHPDWAFFTTITRFPQSN